MNSESVAVCFVNENFGNVKSVITDVQEKLRSGYDVEEEWLRYFYVGHIPLFLENKNTTITMKEPVDGWGSIKVIPELKELVENAPDKLISSVLDNIGITRETYDRLNLNISCRESLTFYRDTSNPMHKCIPDDGLPMFVGCDATLHEYNEDDQKLILMLLIGMSIGLMALLLDTAGYLKPLPKMN